MRPASSLCMRKAIVALCMLLLAGCKSSETSTTVLEPEPTPLDQGTSERDRALVGEVRRRLVTDHDLSFAAKNIVVVVRDGVVTLRGQVRDEADHVAVIRKVVSVPDVVRLDDRLTWS